MAFRCHHSASPIWEWSKVLLGLAVPGEDDHAPCIVRVRAEEVVPRHSIGSDVGRLFPDHMLHCTLPFPISATRCMFRSIRELYRGAFLCSLTPFYADAHCRCAGAKRQAGSCAGWSLCAKPGVRAPLRSCFQMSQPEGDRSDGEHRQIVDGPLLIAGGNAPELLEAVDESLDDVPPSVGGLVEPHPSLAFLARDHDPDPPSMQIPPDPAPTVALVPGNPIGSHTRLSSSPLDRSLLHQRLDHGLLVALSSGDQQYHRLAVPLGPDVDLGPEASLAPSQCLVGIAQVVDPLFCAPAACWWARIMVPST
jgi:hypothetical protein